MWRQSASCCWRRWSQPSKGFSERRLSDEEFEAGANQLAEEWAAASDSEALPLPDEAVTRAGIYGAHP
ncbi:MAG: hypothetical protein GY856_49610 [bacterium]|nr:hypothetical protein [bacterium]